MRYFSTWPYAFRPPRIRERSSPRELLEHSYCILRVYVDIFSVSRGPRTLATLALRIVLPEAVVDLGVRRLSLVFVQKLYFCDVCCDTLVIQAMTLL